MSDADEALEVEHESLLAFLYLCPVAIAQLDASGTIEMMNSAGARILQPIAHGGSIENLFDVLGPFGAEVRAIHDRFPHERGSIIEGRRVTFASPRREGPVVLSLTLVKISPVRTMAVIADETERAAQERAAVRAERRVRAAFDQIRDYAVFALDRDGAIETWSKSAERVFQFQAQEVVGRPCSTLYDEEEPTPERLGDLLAGAAKNGWSDDEGWWKRKHEGRLWGSSVVAVIDDECPGDAGFVVVTRDITQKKREEDDLRLTAATDFLTGVHNRRSFEDAATRELEERRQSREPLSLVMIDADHFKKVNDTYGHGTGDDVLKALANTLKAHVRAIDIVARLGGEEFVLLLPRTDEANAFAVAERVRTAVEQLGVSAADGTVVRFTVSTGVVEASHAAASLEDLLHLADEALYEAKRQGRNRSIVATGSATQLAVATAS